MVWTLLGAAEEKKRENQMFLKSPLSGRKKSASTFLPPEKKEHLEDFTAEEVVRARKGKKKGG